MMKRKRKGRNRLKKFLSNSITAILFIVFIGMMFIVISSMASGGEPQLFGKQLKTVLSGSMEPEFQTGSVIAVEPVQDTEALKKGDVISFVVPDGTMVTHRITDVTKNGDQTLFQTKGDNNKEADTEPVLSQNVVAKYTGFTIPYLGYFVDFAKSNKGMALLMIIPGVFLLGYSAFTIRSALKEIDQNQTKKELDKPA
ncbi:signal peptidase I SipW [Rossellomorea marisflavi]|uniref:signal peptidase I SipW n=1 Tax=Rossellomorea marisflavi TaxID=189381 RepID=UPI003EBFF8F7